ncbi:MAG: YraN family protein [Armatimonadota bacterium]|nr:YraN family protein [Armatimonadota bacterium]
MGTARSALGRAGEERAIRHLESIGYKVVERNFRCSSGEIDAIAYDGSDLVFIEVKARRGTSFGYPSEAVDSLKQAKLIRSAEIYLADRNLGEVGARFDIVEVYFEKGKLVRIEVIKGAFMEDR